MIMECCAPMDLAATYKCLSDVQRVRILNLLGEGPLCVCFLQEILEEGQVKMSKQLGYMKRLGLLTSQREGFWMVYRLVEPVPALVPANLACLRSQPETAAVLSADLAKRAQILARVEAEGCCPSAVVTSGVGADEADEAASAVHPSWNDFPL